MKKTLLLIAVAALVVGCTTSRQVTGPDGRAAHSISCNGAANSMGSCLEKAGDICGASGYEVVNQDGSSTPFGLVNGRWTPSGGSFRGTSGAIVNRSLLVRCKSLG